MRPTRADPVGRASAGGRSGRPGGPRHAGGQPLAASWDPRPEPVSRRDGTGRIAQAVSVYGWRIYAVPVLAVLTLVVVLDAARSPVRPSWGGPSTSGFPAQPLIPNPSGGPGFDAAKVSAELPGGGPFTVQGAGTWRVIPGAGTPFGTGQLFTYTVEVEDGVELEGGPAGFAAIVDSTLRNPKSWIGSGRYQFQRIDDSRVAALRISLTSQLTTRRLCGFRIPFDASCWKPEDRRAVINTARWARGAVAFQGNVVQYEQYVVNHEVGHGLGFPHIACTETGQLAPVMMQQTWGVSDDYLAALGTDQVPPDGKTCEPNAWPFPTVP